MKNQHHSLLLTSIALVSVNIGGTDDEITTKLSDAATEGIVNAIYYYAINNNITPNLQDIDGNSLLHKATLNGHADVVKTLLDHNADPNITNSEGETPLHWLHHGTLENQRCIFEYLIYAGADPYKRDVHNKTPEDTGMLKQNTSHICNLYIYHRLNTSADVGSFMHEKAFSDVFDT